MFSVECSLFSGLRLVREGGGAAPDPGHPAARVRAQDRETQGGERGGLKSDREAADSAQTTNRAELFEKKSHVSILFLFIIKCPLLQGSETLLNAQLFIEKEFVRWISNK